MHREVTIDVSYRFGDSQPYESRLVVKPSTGELLTTPQLDCCESTGCTAPKECFGRCDITGVQVLRHLLVQSEVSARRALPEHTLRCSLSSRLILIDEAELSAVTGNQVARSLMKICAVTGKRAEPEHFGTCSFTGAEVLNTELGISDHSGRRYRLDQQLRSVVSRKAGHKEEFLFCHETRQPMLPNEAEQCELTGELVRPGVLERCALTGKSVLPSELARCEASDRRVLKTMLVSSSISGARLERGLAVRSVAGAFCTPTEAKVCLWSGRRSHPDDLRTCSLTGIAFHNEFAGAGNKPCLQTLGDLLHGVRRSLDEVNRWEDIASKASTALRGRCRVETACLSPDKKHLAICAEVRTLLGLRLQQAGMLYSIEDGSILGRIAMGKRTSKGWIWANR